MGIALSIPPFTPIGKSVLALHRIVSGVVLVMQEFDILLSDDDADFWFPEINHKYIEVLPEDPTRYYHELREKFVNPIRVGAYVVAFVFLILHLLHGFQSAFQSMGMNNKYSKGVRSFGKAYAIVIPLLFIFIALFHHFTH